jgi:transketolase
VLRLGTAGTVIAVGPLADEVVAATLGLDVTVLYAATVRPFDGATLRDTLRAPDVVLVEPYLAGTSSAEVARALPGTRHRVLGLGVGRTELRRYGTAAEHERVHGLDAASLRAAITGFLGGRG